MKKENYNYHIEYAYPDIRKQTLRARGGLVIVTTVAIVGLYSYLIIPAFFSDIAVIGVWIGLILIPFTILPWVWVLFDNYRFFTSPHTAYNARAKAVITRDYIAIYFGKRQMRELCWSEVEILEKTRYEDKTVIFIITNKWQDRAVVCDDKQKNYICLPARPSLEKAIERFSGRAILLADKETYRFVK